MLNKYNIELIESLLRKAYGDRMTLASLRSDVELRAKNLLIQWLFQQAVIDITRYEDEDIAGIIYQYLLTQAHHIAFRFMDCDHDYIVDTLTAGNVAPEALISYYINKRSICIRLPYIAAGYPAKVIIAETRIRSVFSILRKFKNEVTVKITVD